MNKEDYEIGQAGMKSLKTGEMIAGSNLNKGDLVMGEILGSGASGYVQAATFKSNGLKVAVKSINIFDKGKRH